MGVCYANSDWELSYIVDDQRNLFPQLLKDARNYLYFGLKKKKIKKSYYNVIN